MFWRTEYQGFEPRTVQFQLVATPTGLPRLHYEAMLLYVSHVLVPQDEGNKERLPTNWMTVGVELL